MRKKLEAATALLSERATALLSAFFAGVAGVAGSYAIAGFTPDFVAGPIAGFMARRMPGAVITFAITVLGDLGHQLNLVGALFLAASVLGGVAFAGIVLGRRLESPPVAPAVAAVGGAGFAFLVTFAGLASVVTGLVVGLVVGVGELVPLERVGDVSPERRRVLGSTASAFALGVAGFVIGEEGGVHGGTVDADMNVGNVPEVDVRTDELLARAEENSLAVDGLEPLVSTSFYEVDINATDPTIDADNWTLSVTGAVDEEVSYDYEDIRGMTPENRFVSLRCVGEGLNGKKLDNAAWTGVPIVDLVEPAGTGLDEECCVMLRAADGFFEEFPLWALEDALLAYGMNGRTLPRGHGYPARALIPGRWGEVNVKWLTEIEILPAPEDGYWEKRGWEGTGEVNTVAKLWVDNRLDDGRMEVAGHAYAGTRGVETVEVSTDGGDTWNEATLSDPLPGDDVWRQWVYRYDPPDGTHEVVVRAVDGTGELQTEEREDSYPSGATGWVSKEFSP